MVRLHIMLMGSYAVTVLRTHVLMAWFIVQNYEPLYKHYKHNELVSAFIVSSVKRL